MEKNRKVIVAMITSLSLCLNIYGLDFKILYLSSEDAVTIDGKECSVGFVFSDSSVLEWHDDLQVMKVADVKANTQYIICAKSVSEKQCYSLSDYFFLEKQLSSRNGGYDTFQELSLLFQGLIPIDRKYSVPTKIMQDDTHFFYLSCVFSGTTINKAISPNKDSLTITVKSVFQIDGEPIEPYVTKAALYYYDAVEETICPM